MITVAGQIIAYLGAGQTFAVVPRLAMDIRPAGAATVRLIAL
jgi:hypothetical protein